MSAIGPRDWMHRPDLAHCAAHVYRREWARTLCGLLVPDASKWAQDSKRRQCKSCLRRISNAKHWIHALLGEQL